MSCPPSPGAIYQWIAVALHVISVIAAWLYAGRKGEHRAFSLWISVVLAADMFGFALRAIVPTLECVEPGKAFAGAARIAFHLDETRFLIWPASLGWLSLRTFSAQGRVCSPGCRSGSCAVTRRWPLDEVLCVYLIALGGLIFGYPFLRGDSLRQFYLGAELVSLFAASVAVASWAQRGGWRNMSPTVIATLAVLLVELTLLATGPWSRGFFGPAWVTQNGGMIALYGVLAALQGAAWYADRGRVG